MIDSSGERNRPVPEDRTLGCKNCGVKLTSEEAITHDCEGDVVETRTRFSDWLAIHREGILDSELVDHFAEVIDAVVQTGKAGSVTVKFTIANNGSAFVVTDQVTTKAPNPTDGRIYWRGIDGSLQRSNPLQPSLKYDDDGKTP